MIKKIIIILITIIMFPFKKIISKKNIILLGTFSRQIYRENTRYLYEYLSKEKTYTVYWITDNQKIKNYLKRKNYKFISTKSPFQMLWVLLRTKIVIDSGTGYFNPFKIMDNDSTIKITTLHGNGPKANFSRGNADGKFGAIEQIKNHMKFDYINYPSAYSIEKVGKKSHLLPNDKLVNLGYPRCDQFFDKDFVQNKYNHKQIIKSLFRNFEDSSKIILYTPTWRPYKFDFPLFNMKNFHEKEFNCWLKENNYYFIYSIHNVFKPQNRLNDSDRIKYLRMSDDPFLDINELMLEVDILLNDYSTTSTDFAILNRPQVFFMPDYEKFLNEKGFVEDFKNIMPGKEVKSFEEFKHVIQDINNNNSLYLNQYSDIKNILLLKYYDHHKGNSSENYLNFINKLLA